MSAKNEAIALAKKAADDLGLKGQERHDFLLDYLQPRQSNPHKIARAEAYAEAQKRDLWKQCAKAPKAKIGFFTKLFPAIAKRRLDHTAQLYRFNLKRWAKEVHASRPGTVVYRERKEFARVQRKAERQRAKKRFAELEKERNYGSQEH